MVFTKQLKYIQILNWDRKNNSITFREAANRYVDNTTTPKTEEISIRYNRVITASGTSFHRKFLNQIKNNVDKIPEKQVKGDDYHASSGLQACKDN